ncbi:MAG: HD-GYP domain-containing protein [Lachnospiraceae bacterium]|nr:HD-GYP domain-containing protein [Lachnospiraceae bacterium]
MRIDQSIVDATGRDMVKRGTFLDDFQIDYIREKGIKGVFIVEGEIDEEELREIQIPTFTKKVIEKNRIDDRSKVRLTESVKKRVGEGIRYLFDNTESEGFVDATNNIADELVDMISKNNAIAIDVNMLRVSDEYTFKHSVDVATIAIIIGKQYGLPNAVLHDLGVAGLLHDIGKARIPAEILNKPSKLTDDEFEKMKKHSFFGYSILKQRGYFSNAVLSGVLQHHERNVGDGYPFGLKNDQIHLFAKIISIADIYDALVTDRPYKQAYSRRTAMEMVLATSWDLDINVMKSFISSVILFPVDSVVELSNGEYAKVVKNDPGYPMRPSVVGIKSGKLYDLSHDMNCANIIIY